MKREPSIGRGKPPFHRGAGCVSRLLPRFYFWAHALAIRQPLVQTLAGQLGAFALRHIQPTAVLRRGMKRQRPRQPSGLLRREGLLQRSRRMGVPVVQHDPNCPRLRGTPRPPATASAGQRRRSSAAPSRGRPASRAGVGKTRAGCTRRGAGMHHPPVGVDLVPSAGTPDHPPAIETVVRPCRQSGAGDRRVRRSGRAHRPSAREPESCAV